MAYNSILRYTVSLMALGLIFTHIDFSSLKEQSSHFSIPVMLLATLAMIGQIFFLNLRWHALLNSGRKKINFQTSLLINIAGYFANILFITSVGGIIAKSGLAIRYGMSVTHALFVTFLDRFMTLAALLILTAVSLPVLSHILDIQMAITLSLTVISIIIVTCAFFWALRTGHLRDLILSNRKLSRLTSSLRNLTENKTLLSTTIVHSIAAQSCFIAGVAILSSGFDYNGNLLEFIALIPVLALIASLPISFGGWGIREGAFIYGLGLIGFSMESAFMLSIQVGLVTLIAPFIVGMPYLINRNFKLPDFFSQDKTS